MVSPADIICGWWFWLGDVYLVLIILTRSTFCAIFCSIVTLELRVWNYSAVFIFWWIWGHFYPWQSLPAIAGLWLVHVIVMVICLTDQDSQCWKIKTEQSSKQWYDSDLHSYLTFSSECLNMSHGIPGRDIICGWWFWLGDVFLVLIISTDEDYLQYSATVLL